MRDREAYAEYGLHVAGMGIAHLERQAGVRFNWIILDDHSAWRMRGFEPFEGEPSVVMIRSKSKILTDSWIETGYWEVQPPQYSYTVFYNVASPVLNNSTPA